MPNLCDSASLWKNWKGNLPIEMDGERNLNLISAYEYYLPSGCVDVLDLHVDVENFARQRMNQIDHEGFVSHHADPPVRENFNFVAVVVTD